MNDGFTAAFQFAAEGDFKECVALLRSEGIDQMFSDSPRGYLNLSESEFAELPAGERTAIQAEALDFMASVSSLARDLIDQAEAAKARGDLEFSKECFTAVYEIGDALAQPDQLEVFQQKGRAIRDAAKN